MRRPPDPTLRTSLAGLDLPSPVLLAAGTAGTLDEMTDVLDLRHIGAVVTKSITREPRQGNPTWRVVPLDVGMLNAIGLANPGLDAFLKHHAPRAADMPCHVVGSIAGNAIDDYAHVANAFDALDAVPAVELNVSCPNVHGGTEFATDPSALKDLVTACRAVLPGTRLFVKLSPIAVGSPGIVQVARTAIDAGADALCLANTVPAMAIDVHTRRPRLANVTGGLSGPAVHPIAVKLVYDVYRGVARDAGVPIIGIGGIAGWQDAAEFILAGATAVQVGTMTYANPRAALHIVKGLATWARKSGESSLTHLIGGLRLDDAKRPQTPGP